MFGLHTQLFILLAVLFGLLFAAINVIGAAMGVGNVYFYIIACFVLMWIQYLIGPKIVEWTMRVRYLKDDEYPDIQQMVKELARKANIPVPKVGIAQISIPNAFAFGRGPSDGRVCVTQGILKLLDKDELQAVLGHELSHLRNRDVLTITLLSVIPMVMYRLAWQFLWFGGGRRRSEGGNTALIGLLAFLLYFITNLLVLYASRIREYFADRGSVKLGNPPAALATALYKLVYGSARLDKEAIKDAEGLKAFFLNDPSRARQEIQELSQLDLDRSGTIDSYELAALRLKKIHLGLGDRLLELISTHPNMLKRIKRLSGDS